MINVRIYETKTLALLADFDSEYVPRVGEHVVVGPHLNVGDIHNTDERTCKVLDVVYQAPYCVHVIVDLGVEGPYLGDVVDASLLEAANEGRRGWSRRGRPASEG
jgi:hypothetical protein